MDLEARRYHGVVREFDRARGCGLIDLETGDCAFVRYSAIIGAGLRVLRTGDHVSFDLEVTPRGPTAVRVIRDQ